MAHRYLGKESSQTMQATALVNEVYLQLVGAVEIPWQDRAHFFAVSANMMRRILVDYARRRGAVKRGGGNVQVSLDDGIDIAAANRDFQIVALDEALDELAKMNSRHAQVVEMRFFGGLSLEETAEVLQISRSSVMRDWKLAKAWLHRELSRKEL
jgi:RNA polymerase sigma factor (TIGR02999 family)